MEKKLLIFRHTPIDVDIKMYEYFATDLWEGEVFVYAETSFKNERNICGYKQTADNITTIILDQTDIKIDDEFFRNNIDSIFIFYGFFLAKKYQNLLEKYKINFGLISERDVSLCDGSVKSKIRKVIPLFTYFKNKYICDHVKCFLAMGMKGVECFHKYFMVREGVLFDFMYNDGNCAMIPEYRKKDDLVRMVYVGRFDYKIKGLDTLIDAVKYISGDYVLDLYGGYGIDADKVCETSRTLNNVNCYGPIRHEDLCRVLNEYDVIIIPSNQDGWNLQCNIAINSGIGAIATDEAVSHEVIQKCGNGRIVHAHNSNELKSTIQELIASPECINEWKSKTISYSDRISYKTVALYLKNVLNYSFSDDKSSRPVCPWL